MRSIVAATVVLIVATCALGQVPAATTSADGASTDLIKLDLAWNEAYKQHDRETLDKILADDFTFTDPQGEVLDKAHYIDAALHDTVGDYRVEDLRARTYGETAIITGRWTEKRDALRFTDVFVRRDNRWRAVASQETRSEH